MITKYPANGLFSRRRLLSTGALVSAAAASGPKTAAAIAPQVAGANDKRSAYSGEYLKAAEEAARWIRTAAISKEQGIAWLPEPDHPQKLTTVGPDNSIYSGSAGTVLFLLELAEATGDPSYLEDARRGGDYLAATWLRPATPGPLPPFSFDWGLAGTAFSLAELWRHNDAAVYRDAALGATKAIADAAKPAGRGVEWSGSPGVTADGGVILYLLYAARTFGDQRFLELAARGGERVLEKAETDPRGGLRWQGVFWPPANPPPGIPPNAWFPNFELGTAGVGYVLARLYEDTGRKEFLTGAQAAALHLRNIATVNGDSALIHYREPDHTDLYYLGYCHGPGGTARLFYQLYKVTKDPDDLEWTEKLARGVMRSGIPEKLTPGYWNVACQCCGSAAVVDFFASLSVATKKAEYRQFACEVADQLISRESDLDGKGYRWYQAWTRVTPWDVNAETGYKIGAAGIGAALLHTDLAVRDRYRAVLFPDNPFPRFQQT